MPEMPEVQTIINDLQRARIVGCQIIESEVFWPKIVFGADVKTFAKGIQHQSIVDLHRRGKYIVFTLSSGWFLLVHLRMTGRLLLIEGASQDSPYIRLRLKLSGNKSLEYFDTRKFGRWYLVENLDSILGHMGPEPLDREFTPSLLFMMLQKHARALKPLLLDQSFIAGMGNIYVDEALWEARLHPLTPANKVTKDEAELLYEGICKVLKRGIDTQGTTLGSGKTNYYRLDGSKGHHQTELMVFRRSGLPCFRCGTVIVRQQVAQRSTHFCPLCQNRDR
ncbi:MAG: DNA-formamidopyrimidine glycosylase [Verrucomicrobia bacterium]|nr:DNA-formamidopyrimidine glycosylase [Verrucomicrobiota bacterium]